jgi:hypothetical protein
MLALLCASAIVACGSGSADSRSPDVGGGQAMQRADAARFLTQATFGPTEAEIDHVVAVGYSAWLDEQFAKSQKLHRDYMDF